MKQVSPQGLQWFQEARFGMFIHWGLYSLLARGEWVMFHENIPVPEYELLVQQFNPARFNADEWVSLAADACARRSDVKLGFYVSLLDWHHPAYRFRKETGKSWSEYVDFMHGQVRELCTHFGELACVWFDGDWPRGPLGGDREHFRPGGSFEYDRLYDMIHTLQPHAVVLNSRHDEPLPGEDIQGFEQDLPGQNTAGFNATTVFGLPLEVCMTINNSWGINANDHNHKSSRRLVHLLARSASVGANLLLNVGPTAEGEILPIQAERLRGVGAWLKVNGESIFGTHGGVIPPVADGPVVSTRRGPTHYLHSLDDVSDCIRLHEAPNYVTRATLLKDGSPVKLEQSQRETTLTLLSWQHDAFDTVIKLE